MSDVSPDTPPLLVPRTFSPVPEGSEREPPQPLSRYYQESVLVVLGDPGAGKTEAFKKAAEEEEGAVYLPVRRFLALSPEAHRGRVLYLDALDEIRARHAEGGTALEGVLQRLDQIGRPKFRLSCRAADWFGGLDTGELKAVSPDGKVTVLRLEPLTEEDIAVIAAQTLDDPEEFINQARARGIFEWLQNPQSLGLILKVVGRGNWPETKTELYERASRLLAQESNEVHSRTGKGQMAEDAVLEAAGHLCAVHLCGGTAGFALTRPASDNDFPYIAVLGDDNRPALEAAGRRKLFRSEGPERIVPVHRTLAEYLAARYLVRLVRKGLPIGRVVSLLTGTDLGVLSEMRGLFAWLACLCPEHSSVLLGRDPLGVVLYGDPAALPGSGKVRLFEELVALAQRDPRFRSEDWTAAPFGALAVPELRSKFRSILEDSTQPVHLVDCVLDALAHGQSMPEFGVLLLDIVRDPQRLSILREDALAAYRNSCPTQVESLLDILNEIQEGLLSDPRDNLRARLLEALFPEVIGLRNVLTYLVEGDANHLGGYWQFLHTGLLDRAGEARLPELLDIWADETQERHLEERGQRFRDFVGEALLRGVEILGDQVPLIRLYRWLGIPLRSYGLSVLERSQKARLQEWFTNHPETLRELFLYWLAVTPPDKLLEQSIYFWNYRCPAAYPPGFGSFLLELISQQEDELVRQFLVRKAARMCLYEMDREAPSLEDLFGLTKSTPGLMRAYDEEASCRIEDWRLEDARTALEHRRQEEEQRRQALAELLSRIEGIQAGTDLGALIFLGDRLEKSGVEANASARQQLEAQFGAQVLAAADSGFVALVRDPARLGLGPFELGVLDSKRKYLQIGSAILVGMEKLWLHSPQELLSLPSGTLARALVHQVVRHRSLDHDWVRAVLIQHPAIAAQALEDFWGALLKRGSSDPSCLDLLWHDNSTAGIAGDVALRLLADFPHVKPQALEKLLLATLLRGDSMALLNLAHEKLANPRALGTKRRTQWLTAAFLLDPGQFTIPLKKVFSRKAERFEYAARFVSHVIELAPDFLKNPQVVEGLMRIFGEASSPREYESERVSLRDISNLVVRWLSVLSAELSQDAHDQLLRFREDRKLAAWHPIIVHMLALQTRKRREAEFSYPDVEHVVQTLWNGPPANATDLHALVCDHLRTLVDEIRNGASDPYKAFWNIDSNGRLQTPRPENDCRDRLLANLRPRLIPLNVYPEPEGHYADQKRGDIKFLSGTVNVPAEVKVHKHRGLWTAISSQLIPRYMRDPGAGGLGIFIVFWFGVEAGSTPRPPAGITPPQNAEELRQALLKTIPAEHQGHVEVIVFDVSPSEKFRKKIKADKKNAAGSSRSRSV